MSKTKFTAQQANDALNEIALRGESSIGITKAEAFEILENSETTLQNLSSTYFKFDKIGQKNSFIFHGFEDTEMQGKTVKVARLENNDGEFLVNGDALLVGACEKLQQLPAYIRTEYVADVKNAKGTYKNIVVKTFPVVS